MAKVGPADTPKEEITVAEQVKLVQTSFETLKPVAQKFVEDFYDKLLTDHPEMRPLFSTADMKNQHAKLISALVMLVQDLGDVSVIRPKLLALGKRHVAYGATAQYYKYVGEALVHALKVHLGSSLTDQVFAAWSMTLTTIVTVMLEGAKEAENEASAPKQPTGPVKAAGQEAPKQGGCGCFGHK